MTINARQPWLMGCQVVAQSTFLFIPLDPILIFPKVVARLCRVKGASHITVYRPTVTDLNGGYRELCNTSVQICQHVSTNNVIVRHTDNLPWSIWRASGAAINIASSNARQDKAAATCIRAYVGKKRSGAKKKKIYETVSAFWIARLLCLLLLCIVIVFSRHKHGYGTKHCTNTYISCKERSSLASGARCTVILCLVWQVTIGVVIGPWQNARCVHTPYLVPYKLRAT